MRYTLSNDIITIQVDSLGAELKSLVKDGREYMWNADPTYWNRTSPVLFPLVGAVKNATFTSHGNTYSMGQHGFARDLEFNLLSLNSNSLTMRLESSEETLSRWPYQFSLEITYSLCGASVNIGWTVRNTGSGDMYFSIGAHPGFLCPDGHSYVAYVAKNGDNSSLVPATKESVLLVAGGGTISHNTRSIEFDNGRLPISRELFRKGNGTLVFHDTSIKRVALEDEKHHEYVTVDFDMPLVALWSPDIEGTPFVCIEPWCGVCDFEDADGVWEHRAYGNKIEAGKFFEKTYSITVD